MSAAGTAGQYAYTPGTSTRSQLAAPPTPPSPALGMASPATTPNYQLPLVGIIGLAAVGLALEWRRIKKGF